MLVYDRKEVNCKVSMDLGIDIRFLNYTTAPMNFKLHWHDYMELVLVKQGSVILNLDINDRPAIVKEGSLMIFLPQQLHALKSGTDEVRLISLFFDIEALKNQTLSAKNFLNLLLDERINLPVITVEPKIISAVNELVEARQAHNPIYLQGKAYQLIGVLLDNSNINIRKNVSFRLHGIFQYIQSNFTKEISVKNIAKEFGYTESHLCRLFKKHTNLSISSYIQLLRIELAKKMLQETDTDINIVAEKCGFSDFSYFCRCFKKYVQMTPSEFRKNMRNIN
ncbi:MAG TPA: AraC family transcriptional regulator [Bacillota bacterium]|nr:AraC family transcriptional regulator [Bacillota bacterium]